MNDLLTGKVHIYSFSIKDSDLSSLLYLVAKEEMVKALSFRQDADRQRFIAGRIITKQLLAKYTGINAGYITIQKGMHQKPFAVDPYSYKEIPHFNISHSGDMVMVAFSKYEVGIDIEEMTPIDIESLSAAVFSAKEADTIHQSTNRLAAFYKLWTRKEAMLKASGLGLTDNLSVIDISEGIDAAFMNEFSEEEYVLFSFQPAENYAGCICFKQGLSPEFITLTGEILLQP